MPYFQKRELLALEPRLQAIQANLIERLWNGLLFLALIGMPASLIRISVTGWLPLYGFQLMLASSFLMMHAFRRRIPVETKPAIILSLLTLTMLSGMFTFGLLSQGNVILPIILLVAGCFFEARVAISVSLFLAGLVAIMGACFVSGVRVIEFDANEYVRSSVGWIALFFSALLYSAYAAMAMVANRNVIQDLLTEIAQQNALIEHQATHDHLTNLPALRLATDRLEMAIKAAQRSGTKVALMFIDLDGFKSINDAFGHEAGDLVLQEVATRLCATVRTSDTAARIGGDEFLIVLGDQTSQEYAATTARRIIDALSAPYDHAGHPLSLGCSIGIAMFPDHGADASTLKRLADVAMYAVKQTGKNNYIFAADADARQA